MSLIGKVGAELAGGEVVQGAEAFIEFGGGEAAIAVERAEIVRGGMLFLGGVALHAARDQVAIGIAAELDARDDVVQALHADGDAAQAIKAFAAFTGVDGLAEGAGLHEIQFLEVGGAAHAAQGKAGGHGGAAKAANFLGQTRFDEMTGLGALDEAEDALFDEAADRLAHRSMGKVEIAGYLENRKAHGAVAFEAAVPHQMKINSAVHDREVEMRRENIIELLPEKFRVWFCVLVLHGFVLEWN
jgi:hypothetical protein